LKLLDQNQLKISPVKSTAEAAFHAVSRHPTNAPDKDITSQGLLSCVIAKTIGNHPKQPEINSQMTTHLSEKDIATAQVEYRADPEIATLAQESVAPVAQDMGLLERGDRTCIPDDALHTKILHGYHDVRSQWLMGVRRTAKALATKY